MYRYFFLKCKVFSYPKQVRTWLERHLRIYTIKHLTWRYCKNLDIKLVFAPYKIENLFSAKDDRSKFSRSRLVYKFSCAGFSACYVRETNWHLAARVRESLTSDKNSHSPQHIHWSEKCRAVRSENCFSILDTATASFHELKTRRPYTSDGKTSH